MPVRTSKLSITGLAAILWATSVAASPLSVFVSVLPQKYFVNRVGGAHVSVSVMVAPGHSPATYEPTPRQMARLATAELYVRIGVPFEEAWMRRMIAANPQMVVIDARDGIPLRDIDGESESTAQHRTQKDPHIWLSPPLVKQMAAQLRDQLGVLDPPNQGAYAANFQRFADDLDRLDADIRSALSGLATRRFLVFHPAWGYFADTYGLQQVPIEAHGKQPGPKSLAQLIDTARTQGTRVVFVQSQFSQRHAQTIADAIGGRVIAIDPLSEHYLTDLRRVAQVFAEAMR